MADHPADPTNWTALVAELAQELDVVVEGGRLRVEGIEWRPPTPISAARARRLLEHVVRAGREVQGARRLGSGVTGQVRWRFTRTRYENLIQELGYPAPIDHRGRHDRSFLLSPFSGAACACVTEEGLSIQYAHETWVTSHETGVVSTEYARVPRSELPLQLDRARGMLQAIAGAAGIMAEKSERTCRFCQQTFSSLHMHDATTCHACAERHLGVIH